MKKADLALLIGAIINLILSVGHFICLLYLDTVFKIYGIDGTINQMTAEFGTSFPYILTAVVAICFLLCGIYGLSASGCIRKLPLLKLGIFTIAGIFLLRALWGLYMQICSFSVVGFSSFAIAAIVGTLYLIGGISILRR